MYRNAPEATARTMRNTILAASQAKSLSVDLPYTTNNKKKAAMLVNPYPHG